MRVTFGTGNAVAMADLERAAEALSAAQRQVASGKRVNSPSDDPSAASATVRERADIATIDQYVRTADSATSRIQVIDTVLSDMISAMTSAQATATAAKGTIQTAAQREATAKSLEGLRDALLSDANASFGGTYLFGGTSTLTPPYTQAADGIISGYLGDHRTLSVNIDRNRTVQISYDAQQVLQGSDSQDLFTTLQGLIDSIRANDQAGVTSGLAGLTRAFDRLVGVQSGVGAQLNALEEQTARLGDMRYATVERLSKDEEANMAQAITKMNQANTIYQAALGAVATRSKQSLLDYLK
jgi:flagellar hook-associated protein 3 FlgL